jgi:hypothetical protein
VRSNFDVHSRLQREAEWRGLLTRLSSLWRESESFFERHSGSERNPRVHVRTPNDLCEPERVGHRGQDREIHENLGKTRKSESGGSRLVVLTRG